MKISRLGILPQEVDDSVAIQAAEEARSAECVLMQIKLCVLLTIHHQRPHRLRNAFA